MRKFSTMILVQLLFAAITNATNFYVDPTSGSNSKDGLSWANAVADISTAITKANTAPYDVTVDNILVKQGTMTFTVAKTYTSLDNIYGSCVGTETSPEQRPLTDLDGNGTIEPWEFQYPTIYSSNLIGYALSLTLTNATFNGFTITHSVNSTSTSLLRSITCNTATTKFENNTVKNCAITTTMTSASINGVVMRQTGLMKNCLFEKNQITVNASYDGGVTPMVEVTGSSKITGCVFRNNNVIVNHSAAANSNMRGMILNVIAGNTSTPSIISNCLIYNNEINYIPSGAALLKTSNSTLVCLSSYSTSYGTTDSIVNCTVANNKTTNLKCAGLGVYFNFPTAPNLPVNHYAINNLFWNNRNDGLKSNMYLTSSAPTAGLVANNFMNGGNSTALASNSTYITNNNISLDSVNTATNGPNFVNPTTTVGNTVDETTEKAVWTIQAASYALNKGIATTVLVDKAGLTLGTSPTVGAYSSTTPLLSASTTVLSDSKYVNILKNGVQINENGSLQLFSLKGDKIKEQKVTKGQFVKLPAGMYIIQFLSTNNITSVTKVII